MRPGVVVRPAFEGPPPCLWTGRNVPHLVWLEGTWFVIASGDERLDMAAMEWANARLNGGQA